MTADLTDRLVEAAGVPVLLAVAYDAFEHMLRELRGIENRAGVLLPAIVLAAAAAGDGRDAVAGAPWFPGKPGRAAGRHASFRRFLGSCRPAAAPAAPVRSAARTSAGPRARRGDARLGGHRDAVSGRCADRYGCRPRQP